MSNIVELRQYTLKPGVRDTLVDLFEREFVESQEALGMELIGQFRDADDPDRFVWLRGFADMECRARALAAFYGGSVWRAHREAANATMIDSDNVLLLRPAWQGSGFADGETRAPRDCGSAARGFVLAQLYYFAEPVGHRSIAALRGAMPSPLSAQKSAVYATESAANNFPALPVREGEHVVAAITLFADEAAAGAVSFSPLPPGLAGKLTKPVELLRLRPTPRSRLHL